MSNRLRVAVGCALLWPVACVLPSPAEREAALRAELARFFAADAATQQAFGFDPAFDAELRTAAGDARLRALVWQALCAHERPLLQADHAQRVVRCGGLSSPFTVKQVGAEPAGGWPLVIAMHGGGGVPQATNDAQWRHMQVYYRDRPEAGGYLYCALRAPNDEWNGFYQDAFYPLLERLIRQFVVCDGVDPDRVLAIGYSHGGYGAFVVGAKLPHRFAAVHASAAAPTDGESSPIGLHTLPFSWMVGGRDTDYGRRARCEAFAAAIRALQQEHPGRYPATFTLVAGNGHTGLPDRDLLAQLVPRVRTALPKELWWEATDAVVRDHYWLHVTEPHERLFVDAALTGQQLTVRWFDRAAFDESLRFPLDAGPPVRGESVSDAAAKAPAAALPAQAWLDARLCDLTQPLEVTLDVATGCVMDLNSWGDPVVPTFEARRHTVEPAPSLRTLCATMQERGDPVLAASWIVELR